MNKIYTTPRLSIRHLNPEDLVSFHKMQSDERVLKYLGLTKPTRSENEADLLQLINRYKDSSNEYHVWAVEHRTNKEFIGTVAIIKNDSSEFEVGYRLLHDYWGRGYATEALEGLIHHALSQMNLSEVVAYVHAENSTSINVLEKSNMQFYCHKIVDDEPHICYKVNQLSQD